MLRALHPNFCAQAADRARLPGLPRGKLIFATRWVVTVLAFWVVLRSIDLGAVVDLIGRAAPLALGVAGLVVIAQFAVLVWRWQLVIHILSGRTVGFGPLALLLGHSCLIGQVLPSSVGGDVARTVLLSRSTGAAAAARSVICDRLIGFAAHQRCRQSERCRVGASRGATRCSRFIRHAWSASDFLLYPCRLRCMSAAFIPIIGATEPHCRNSAPG
jgi:hypothetical protein